ncbi:MAG: hypothetical protein HY929_04660 [Euryarchaeota archaeon]|nr:hypothetical protein [Euryarchaeota archaeon]
MEARDPGRRIPCIGCHQIGTKIQAQGIACHNPGLIDSVHKKTCLICHKRMLNTENESAIHAIHAKKECVLCHREPAKPSSECTSCHGNDHHRVHQRVVDKICVKCHGEIEKAYINISTFEQTQKNVTAYKLKSTLAKKFSYVKKLIKSILDKFLVY